jgi:hypothetical protein
MHTQNTQTYSLLTLRHVSVLLCHPRGAQAEFFKNQLEYTKLLYLVHARVLLSVRMSHAAAT